MEKQITYKLQGDGKDSWRIDEIENNEIVSSYMVYDDPNLPVELDIDSLTDAQILKLKQRFDALK
jgi:hypothetical protein